MTAAFHFANRLVVVAAGLILFLPGMPWAGVAKERPARGMVASGHPLATEVGLEVLRSGGNAVDAAVAVGFTLGVVDTHNSGIGGGCFMLIRLADGRCVAIDGRETAPAAATRDLFVREGRADTRLSQSGALASGVPGQLAAFDYALRTHGRKSLRDLILPAAGIAERGFPINANYTSRIQSVVEDLRRFDASRMLFLPGGQPLKPGDVLRQPDLARTYRHIAEEGADWFYHGPFAQAVATWMKDHGGVLTAADFADYRVMLREPVRGTYRNHEVVTFAPPSSGGVHLVQMLNLLESFPLASMNEAARLHIIAEAMKFAFADRAHWLGDPDFARVPRGLLAKTYAAGLAARIDTERATPVAGHGLPPAWEHDVFKKHTTHFSVADADGNWVACTATINTAFGSKVVIPGTGVVLNNQMDDFSVQPGVPNVFGLIGAEANAVAPGKRPLSSMTPTILLQEGRPVAALGAAGGPRIISSVLLSVVNFVDLGLSPAEALAAPRIHHQWSPDELWVEPSVPESVRMALVHRGHQVRMQDALAVAHMVAWEPGGGGFVGAADPRGGGAAAGW